MVSEPPSLSGGVEEVAAFLDIPDPLVIEPEGDDASAENSGGSR